MCHRCYVYSVFFCVVWICGLINIAALRLVGVFFLYVSSVEDFKLMLYIPLLFGLNSDMSLLSFLVDSVF
jgi:hypothetical protein